MALPNTYEHSLFSAEHNAVRRKCTQLPLGTPELAYKEPSDVCPELTE